MSCGIPETVGPDLMVRRPYERPFWCWPCHHWHEAKDWDWVRHACDGCVESTKKGVA